MQLVSSCGHETPGFGAFRPMTNSPVRRHEVEFLLCQSWLDKMPDPAPLVLPVHEDQSFDVVPTLRSSPATSGALSRKIVEGLPDSQQLAPRLRHPIFTLLRASLGPSWSSIAVDLPFGAA